MSGVHLPKLWKPKWLHISFFRKISCFSHKTIRNCFRRVSKKDFLIILLCSIFLWAIFQTCGNVFSSAIPHKQLLISHFLWRIVSSKFLRICTYVFRRMFVLTVFRSRKSHRISCIMLLINGTSNLILSTFVCTLLRILIT